MWNRRGRGITTTLTTDELSSRLISPFPVGCLFFFLVVVVVIDTKKNSFLKKKKYFLGLDSPLRFAFSIFTFVFSATVLILALSVRACVRACVRTCVRVCMLFDPLLCDTFFFSFFLFDLLFSLLLQLIPSVHVCISVIDLRYRHIDCMHMYHSCSIRSSHLISLCTLSSHIYMITD